MMLEKLEQCPHCKKALDQGEYDFQFCRKCGTGMDFQRVNQKKGKEHEAV